MYILLTGIPPFNGKDDRAIIEKVKSGRYSLNKPAFKYVSDTAKDLLQKMLMFDVAKRPTALECYNHKWFKNDHKLDKKKLDAESLENFKNFHVRNLQIQIKSNSSSTKLSSRELSTISWLTTLPLKRRRKL